MKLADLIREPKTVLDYGRWSSGEIERADWPMRRRKLKQSRDWQWRVVRLSTESGRPLRVLLKLNIDIEQFYALLGDVRDDGIAVLCSHELHTSHGNWHCHATVGLVDEVVAGAWRDRDSLRKWPVYAGDSSVVFAVDRKVALQTAAALYRFDLPPQTEMFE